MRSVEAIEQALRAALPAEHQSQAPALAHALIDHVDGSTSAPLPPKLGAALRALAGQNITAGDSVLNFGLDNNFGDVTIGELVGRDKITITLALPTSPLSPQERRNRQALIRNVRTVAIAPLDRLLSEEPYLALGLAEHPDAVSGTPTLLARAAPPKPAQIPHGTPIVEVFDQRGGALLILGAPGAGKTVLLLELCRALLERAERDEQLSIPVVFNLASWSARHSSLADWMAEELDTTFNVSQKTARQWVEDGVILPLLDGLDEVAPSARGPCVRAINAYHGDHPVPLAVCARETDYRAIGVKLHLIGTVLVKPLSDAQIGVYLERSGEVLAGLRQVLTHDAALCELATSPLMLSVMAVAYAYKPAEAIVEAADHRALWDTYLDAMFRRGAPGRSLGRDQTLTYLRWLAGALQRHPQAVFHLEHLQPDWLPTNTDRRWYTIADRLGSAVLVGGVALALCLPMSESLVAGTVALACAGVAGLYGGRPRTLAHGRWPAREVARDVLVGGLLAGAVIATLQGVVDGLNAALIGSTAAALAGGPSLRPRPIVTVEALHWSWRRALRVGAAGLGSGILVGLVNGMIIGDWSFALPFALVVGGTIALLVGSIGGLARIEVSSTFAVNQGMRRSAWTALFIGVLVAILAGVLVGGVFAPLMHMRPSTVQVRPSGTPLLWRQARQPNLGQTVVTYGVASGLLAALVYGGYAILAHGTLRLVLWRRGALPLNLVAFLDACVDRSLLRRVGGGYSFIHRLFQEHLTGAERSVALQKADAIGPPQSIAGFIDHMNHLRRRTLAHVQAIPPEHSTWSPGEGAPTCADIVASLARAEDRFISAIVGAGWRDLGINWDAGTHNTLLHQLETGHRAAIEQLRVLPDSVLQEPRMALDGRPTRGWRLLIALIEHESHCCGQIATYLTLLGAPLPALDRGVEIQDS